MIDATPTVQAAPAPPPVSAQGLFRPPLGRPLTVHLSDTRLAGGRVRRFTTERRLLFRRDAAGLVAEVRLLAAKANGNDAFARRVLAAMRLLEGLTVRLRLSDMGRVVAVEEEEALWTAAAAAFRRAGGTAGRHGGAIDPAALPPAARRAILASLVAALVDASPRASGTRRVTLPGGPPGAGPATLAGTEETVAAPDGLLTVTVLAQGSGASASVTLERVRRIDPRTGLVLRLVERRRTEAAGRVAEQVSETWLNGPGIIIPYG